MVTQIALYFAIVFLSACNGINILMLTGTFSKEKTLAQGCKIVALIVNIFLSLCVTAKLTGML